MTARIDAATLRKRLVQSADPALAQRWKDDADAVETDRMTLECSLAGVVTLYTLARLETVVAGMPDAVDLGMLTGSAYLWGRRDGDRVWRLWGNPEGYRSALSLGLGMPHRGRFARQILAAFAAPDGPNARHELMSASSWTGTMEQTANDFAAAARHMPRHAVVASLRYGTELLRGLDIPQDGERMREFLRGLRPAARLRGMCASVHFDDFPMRDMDPALHGAVARRDGLLVDTLLRAGANVDVASSGGETPLMAAAAMGDQFIVDCLLDHGPSPAQVSDDGCTVLHSAAFAIAKGEAPSDLVAYLAQFVQAGADPGVRDYGRQTAADFLREAAEETRARGKDTRFGIPLATLEAAAAYLDEAAAARPAGP